MTKTKGHEGPRTVALVGPYLSGKTSLLESLLAVGESIPRKGTIAAQNTVGDASPEARAHQMSTEITCAHTQFMGEPYVFLDCPGSIEFLQETMNALPVVDAAIVVCDPDEGKTGLLKPVLKQLDDHGIPHLLFVNKIDKAGGNLDQLIETLQAESERPLVLRQIPITDGEDVTGFIDLALERAFNYKPNAPSEQVDMPEALADAEKQARYQMLEAMADHDDHLMEELLEDVEPDQSEVVDGLAREASEGLIVPVLIGSAENDNGVRRLFKALRHEVGGIEETNARLGYESAGASVHILKTIHTQHGGKLSIARVMTGTLKDGDTLFTSDGREGRISGLYRLMGQAQDKIAEAPAGFTVGLGRLDDLKTGDTASTEKSAHGSIETLGTLGPVYHFAVGVTDRKDEVKMTSAIAKLVEEDPSLSLRNNLDTHETILSGQGEMHLRIALERLKSKYALGLETKPPRVPYKEAIRKGAKVRGRHKKQSGGHGQFGDVVIEITPLARGEGFRFDDKITGGVVPKNYIPAVEAGVRDYLSKGPLGFPVVDVAVTLTDGSYHTVDSSDMAFRTAGRLAMSEGMPDCAPVLLEPIMKVEVHIPTAATPKINQMISGRRGQILGFDARTGWPGWDTVYAQIPQAELHDLIIELRSATAGAGTYSAEFDHLAELTGRHADDAVKSVNAA